MEYRHQYDEIMIYFGGKRLKDAGAIQKDLQLHDVNITCPLVRFSNYRLHRSGRRLENTSEGILLQITEKAESAGKLVCHLYLFQDAQINISDAQFLNVVY